MHGPPPLLLREGNAGSGFLLSASVFIFGGPRMTVSGFGFRSRFQISVCRFRGSDFGVGIRVSGSVSDLGSQVLGPSFRVSDVGIRGRWLRSPQTNRGIGMQRYLAHKKHPP